jgi:hypothetical protein
MMGTVKNVLTFGKKPAPLQAPRPQPQLQPEVSKPLPESRQLMFTFKEFAWTAPETANQNGMAATAHVAGRGSKPGNMQGAP